MPARPMRNDDEAGASAAPARERISPLPTQAAAAKLKDEDVQQKLDARLRALEAAIRPHERLGQVKAPKGLAGHH